jgi:hypothetical protein
VSKRTFERVWSSIAHRPSPYSPPVRNTSNEVWISCSVARARPWPRRNSISAAHSAWDV